MKTGDFTDSNFQRICLAKEVRELDPEEVEVYNWGCSTTKAGREKMPNNTEQFCTGSQRDSREGKGRFDLIPPHVLQALAKHYEEGGKKYGDKNWLKGQPLSRYLDSGMRHINNHLRGMRDEENIIAAIWNLIAIWETSRLIEEKKLPQELNDL